MKQFTLNTDKLPSAIDLEEVIVGAMMMEKDAFFNVPFLDETMFYDQRNALVFKACKTLIQSGRHVDILTVKEELKTIGQLDKAGGAFHISELTNRVVSAANIEVYARIVHEYAIRRNFIMDMHKKIQLAWSEQNDIFEVLSEAHGNISNLCNVNNTNAVSLEDAYISTIKNIENERAGKIDNTIPLCYESLRSTITLRTGQLVTVAGLPGTGKTAFTIPMLVNSGEPGLIFSMEMTADELTRRLISQGTGIDQYKLTKPKYLKSPNDEGNEWNLINEYGDNLNSNVYICDDGAVTLLDLIVKVRWYKIMYNIKWFVVDYYQLLSLKGIEGDTKTDKQEEITKTGKQLAKDEDLLGVYISQLSKIKDNRPPNNSDLRGSGSLEQDSNTIILLDNPHKRGLDSLDDGTDSQGKIIAIVSKNRSGPLRQVPMKWEAEKVTISDLDDEEYAERWPNGINPEPYMTFDEKLNSEKPYGSVNAHRHHKDNEENPPF